MLMGQISAIPIAGPPLRHGRRRHGSPAMGATLRRQAPEEGGTIYAEVSAAHTEPSLAAAVTLC